MPSKRALLIVLTFTLAALAGRAFAAEPEATMSLSGALTVQNGETLLCNFVPGIAEKGWRFIGGTVTSFKDIPADAELRKFKVGASFTGEARIKAENGKVSNTWTYTAVADVTLNSLHICAEYAVAEIAGGKWKADDKSGAFPADLKDTHLLSAEVKQLEIELANGEKFTLNFPQPTPVLLQDNRKWGPTFSIRVGPQGEFAMKKGEQKAIAFSVSTPGKISLKQDGLTTIQAGKDWIPLKLDLDIEPNSALDFSTQNFTEAPAGKHGRVIAKGGHFAFENSPDTPRRFYGVNLCFSAQFIKPEECERVAERLYRLGYNAVRIHHYEGGLAEGQADSTQFNAQRLEQLDNLLAACKQRGLYITTDLFVSRPVKWKDIGIDKDGHVPMDTFKILIPVNEKAYENWKAFSKNFLTHVNPRTKVSYAEEPALAWLSMINEGNAGNFFGELRKYPEWQQAWAGWLKKTYATQEKLAAGWGGELKAGEELEKASVAMPDNIYNANVRTRDAMLFLTDIEIDMIERMKKFLRDELKCKALITNCNAWTHPLCMQFARQHYDYVDDHFYIDHPEFLEKPWQLPSRCPNTSPIKTGGIGGKSCAFLRIMDKPFTITEFNYSGPGRYRGVGGILTGAIGSIQDWSGLWRFAYAHWDGALREPQRITYFDMASDPLGQASERATLMLFLRGDMRPAKGGIIQAVAKKDLPALKSMPWAAPDWQWAALMTRVGFQEDPQWSYWLAGEQWAQFEKIEEAAKKAPNAALFADGQTKKLDVLNQLKAKLPKDHPLDPSKNLFRSVTGEITLNGQEDTMILDTPRTAGGYAPAGKSIVTNNGVKIEIQDADATAWVSALDDKPIGKSARLLVTHLTDLQNTDIKYAEAARQTLLEWGKLPHLVRAGKAVIEIKHESGGTLKVWALSTSGRRLAEVPSNFLNGVLTFTADVAADPASARMTYEISAK